MPVKQPIIRCYENCPKIPMDILELPNLESVQEYINEFGYKVLSTSSENHIVDEKEERISLIAEVSDMVYGCILINHRYAIFVEKQPQD